MSNKYGYSPAFFILKNYTCFAFKRFYSEYIVVGRENIPQNAPIIFAPNHLNALMDAVAVHSIAPKNTPVTFLARSDIFKKKNIAKLLNFIHIMPAFRMRDGMENLGKNGEVFDRCVDILHHNKAIGIMPEGNQGELRYLRPLVKGIFRIAFAAQQKYGLESGVKIIPVGIDFGSIEKFGKHIIINIGKPIEIADYMAAYDENPVTATNQLRDRLHNDLINQSLDIASEKHYNCFETAIEAANTAFVDKNKSSKSTIFRFKARLAITKRLCQLEATAIEKIDELEVLCEKYAGNLKILRLRTRNIEEKPHLGFLALDLMMLIIGFPIFINGFITNILPFYLPVAIRKAITVEYPGFFSSIQFGLACVSFPIFYLIQTIAFACILNANWWTIGLFAIGQYVLGKWSYQWYCQAKCFSAQFRHYRLVRKESERLKETKEIQKQIIKLIK